LNHPNIATIHGLEDGAIVMELVEGQTLAERIQHGPLPLAEALPIARQIAEALEAAHEKGIIHRDLKPANVKITNEGVVKVLDFGLAKASEPASKTTLADSPTLTIRATQAGIIVGTASYMSPEQAAGKPVDKRADIWSFGVLLWEVLTGRRLFEGETISHTLADVLRAQIDLKQLPPGTPASIRELIRRCLDRNVKIRLRDIGEARVTIQRYLSARDAAEGTAVPVSVSQRHISWVPWTCLAEKAAAGVASGDAVDRGAAQRWPYPRGHAVSGRIASRLYRSPIRHLANLPASDGSARGQAPLGRRERLLAFLLSGQQVDRILCLGQVEEGAGHRRRLHHSMRRGARPFRCELGAGRRYYLCWRH